MTEPLLIYGGRSKAADEVHVKLETLYETRMLIQGSSGAGKTQACFQLLEETHGRVQQIVVDKEGEFGKLREQFDYLLIGGDGEQRIPMRKGALELQLTRVLELEISAIYDLSDLPPDAQRHVVARLARAMAHLPQRSGLWERMRLLLLDEAQWFAPQQGKAESLEPLIELASLGRKRGFCPIAAGTRVAMIAKSFTELLENKLIGRAGTNDSKRAAEELEFDKHGRKELRSLAVGRFFAYGPAIALDPILVRTPDVLPVMPRRRGEHQAPTPATSAKVKKALEKFAGLEEEAAEKERTMEELERQLAGAQAKIRQLEKSGGPVRAPGDVSRETMLSQIDAAVNAARRETLRDMKKRLGGELVNVSRSVDAIVRALRPASDAVSTAAEAITRLDGILVESSIPSSSTSVKSTPSARQTNAELWTPPLRAAAPARRDREVSIDVSAEGEPTPKQREILEVLRSFERIGVTAVPRPNLAAFVGYSASTKSFKNAMSAMRTAGWLDYSGDGVMLTEDGRALAGDGGPALLTLEALHQAWRDRLTPADWKLLEPVLDDRLRGGRGIPRDVLAENVGYATSTKSFKNGLSKLRTLGAIDYKGGDVVATDMLFPEALT